MHCLRVRSIIISLAFSGSLCVIHCKTGTDYFCEVIYLTMQFRCVRDYCTYLNEVASVALSTFSPPYFVARCGRHASNPRSQSLIFQFQIARQNHLIYISRFIKCCCCFYDFFQSLCVPRVLEMYSMPFVARSVD